MNSTDAKIIGFPGDLSIGPGATLTFLMESPCDFLGRRLVVESIDLATGSNQVVMIRSARHDNLELIANGRVSLVPNTAFPPPIWRFEPSAVGSGAATATDTYCEFHEQFYTGDLFEITIFNQTANNTQNIIYWITDYGEKCGCPRKR